MYINLENIDLYKYIFMPPFEEDVVYCFANVGL